MEVFILLLGMQLSIGLSGGVGLRIHRIADPQKGAHCMQQQAMIPKKITRITNNNHINLKTIVVAIKLNMNK